MRTSPARVQAMNDPWVEFKAAIGWIVASLLGLVFWFSRRDMSRYDKGLERIDMLERNAVTYDHLDRVLDQMRADRTAMHSENQSSLTGSRRNRHERGAFIETRHETPE